MTIAHQFLFFLLLDINKTNTQLVLCLEDFFITDCYKDTQESFYMLNKCLLTQSFSISYTSLFC